MSDGAIDERWLHTATVCATMANCHRTKGRRYKPKDFIPKRKGSEEKIPIKSMGPLRKQFESFKKKKKGQ